MTKTQRAEKTSRAVEMNARGMSCEAISRELSIHWNTVRKLIDDDLANRAEHRSQDKERSLVRYEHLYRIALADHDAAPDTSLNKSGYINAAVRILERIDRIVGNESPKELNLNDRREPTPTEREANELEREIAALETGEAEEGEG